MHDTARDLEWFWDKSKFINRVYLIRERYERFAAGEAPAGGTGEEAEKDDPFWDPNEPAAVRPAARAARPPDGRSSTAGRRATRLQLDRANDPAPVRRTGP